LSPIILQRLLREALGFRGVICSDSLLMAGVRDRFDTEEEMALAVLNAGVDVLLDINEPEGVVKYLCHCVDRGLLSDRRVDEAFERVWQLKTKCFGPVSNAAPELSAEETKSPSALAATVARGAIEVVGDSTGLLPYRQDVPLVAVLLKPFQTPIEPPEQPLAAALRRQFSDVRYIQLGPRSEVADFEAAEYLSHAAEQLLVAIIVRPAAWYAFGLLAEQRAFVEWITQERKVVLASLGVPYALHDFPDAAERICTYSDVPASQYALAEFLLATGRSLADS
jgi:hypothetical protein